MGWRNWFRRPERMDADTLAQIERDTGLTDVELGVAATDASTDLGHTAEDAGLPSAELQPRPTPRMDTPAD